MTELDLFILLHILLFVYWLGGDVGVFYSSKFVLKPELSNESRLVAAKIMLNLDLIPRICMTLMLTVGGVLAELYGVKHPTWQMVGIWLLAPFWLSMVLLIHFREGTPLARTLTRIDYWFRWFLILGILVSVSYSWSIGRFVDAPWLAFKILIFAVLVFCGLMIRIYLPPYITGLHKMGSGQNMSDADNAAMISSMSKARPWVLVIWAGLVMEATLGIVKPFDKLSEDAMLYWQKFAAVLS